MQDVQPFQELSDQDLEAVVGGSGLSSFTSTGITVSASATGGKFHLDRVLTNAQSSSITTKQGESVSLALGFAIAIAV